MSPEYEAACEVRESISSLTESVDQLVVPELAGIRRAVESMAAIAGKPTVEPTPPSMADLVFFELRISRGLAQLELLQNFVKEKHLVDEFRTWRKDHP